MHASAESTSHLHDNNYMSMRPQIPISTEQNFFSGTEIYFKGLEIYFSGFEIYFKAFEIVL